MPSEYFSIFIIKQNTHNYKPPTYQSIKDFWNGLVDCQGFPSCISSSSQASLVTLAKKNVMLGAFPHGEGCSTRQWYDSHVGSKTLLWHPALAACSALFAGSESPAIEEKGSTVYLWEQNCSTAAPAGRSVRRWMHSEAGLSAVQQCTTTAWILQTCSNSSTWEALLWCT